MGKSKRNKRNRDQRPAGDSLHQFLHGRHGSDLDEANRAVRQAEANLLEARRRAAQAAEAMRTRPARTVFEAGQRATSNRVRRNARVPVDLDDARGQAPEDQAAAFFNRPGDYYLARFTLAVGDAPTTGAPAGPKLAAETVLKASEDQFDYLLEVLRQIRGGFGDRCRIELYRTHTVEQAPDPGPGHFPEPEARLVDGLIEATEQHTKRQAREMLREHLDDGPPIPMNEFRLGERYSSADAGHDQHPPAGPYTDQVDGATHDQVPPWLADAPPYPKPDPYRFTTKGPAKPTHDVDTFANDGTTAVVICGCGRRFAAETEDAAYKLHAEHAPAVHESDWYRDLTREELQQQLPGMTRAEAAAELGKRPEDIGGTFQATGDLEREKLAAEVGVPVEHLQPIRMSNGGYAYAVKPPAAPAEGRHAKPEESQP